MFFEQSEIIDLLKCENCSQQYDEYSPPRILPCCGKTLCYTCIQSIEKQLKNNKFKCIACNKEDTIPNNGFQINNAIVKFISKKPKEISRGIEVDKLKQNLLYLESLVNNLLFEMDNGAYIITEACKELRRQVQLAKEEKIEEINQQCDALFLKIDAYEEKCKSKYKEMNESVKQKANKLIKSVNESIKKQNEYLKQLMIDENEAIKCNQKMDELKAKIEEERKNIKKSMFDNQIMKFETNTATIGEEFLGKLMQHTFDFTVIIQNKSILFLT